MGDIVGNYQLGLLNMKSYGLIATVYFLPQMLAYCFVAVLLHSLILKSMSTIKRITLISSVLPTITFVFHIIHGIVGSGIGFVLSGLFFCSLSIVFPVLSVFLYNKFRDKYMPRDNILFKVVVTMMMCFAASRIAIWFYLYMNMKMGFTPD